MKKLSYILAKGSNYVLAGLLALLGFSACKDNSVMYGVPHGDYIIKGKVTDEAHRPIANIQIQSLHPEGNLTHADTLYSNSQGEFGYKEERIGNDIPLVFTDIDGEANGGHFATDTLNISFKDVEFKGGDDWYMGEGEKEITVVLKKKTEGTNKKE
jgi:putative lipoprotein (rSAM/lipoprotein system)